VIRVGGESIYRVMLNAMNDAITQWPDELVAPAQLQMRPGARGQILQLVETTISRSRSSIIACGPRRRARFWCPSFWWISTASRDDSGVRLQVVADPLFEPAPPPRLLIEVANTNVFIGRR